MEQKLVSSEDHLGMRDLYFLSQEEAMNILKNRWYSTKRTIIVLFLIFSMQWLYHSGKDISIRIDHEYTENVKVDDQEVDKVHYKVTKGSMIITFGDMYLNILAVGTHHVKVTFEDGIATTTLLIKEQTKDDNNRKDSTSNNQETVKPTINEETKTTVKAENKEEVKKVKTGGDENIIGVVLLLIGSLVVLTYIRKKKIE